MKRAILCIILAGIVFAASGCKKETVKEKITGVYEMVDPEPVYPEDMELAKDGTLIRRSVSKYRIEENNGKKQLIREQIGNEKNSDSQQFWNIVEKDGKYQLVPDAVHGGSGQGKFTLTFESGKDGLTGTEPFDGVYYSEGDYRASFTFHKDGNTTWEVKMHKYSVDEEEITFIGAGGSKTYSYQLSDDGKELDIKISDKLTTRYKKK